MKNITRNTAAVLVLTLFTGLAVFTAVQLGDRLFGTSEANAQAVTTQAAVQSSSEDQSAADDYYDDGTSGSGNAYGQSDPYGYGDSTGSSSSSGETTMTCPATGCSASTCHAMQ
jgi:hypothetical protein